MSTPIVIKPVNEQLVDVFVGNGWNHWSRFYKSFNQGKLFLKLVKGVPMSKEDFRNLYEEMSK